MVSATAVKMNNFDDFALETADHGFDLELVEDEREVAQATSLRLRTIEGEDVWHNDAGLPIGPMLGVLDQEFVRSIIQEEVLKDGRIDSMDDFEIEHERAKRILKVVFTLVMISGENAPVTTSFKV